MLGFKLKQEWLRSNMSSCPRTRSEIGRESTEKFPVETAYLDVAIRMGMPMG
jgi:hypothetical protein